MNNALHHLRRQWARVVAVLLLVLTLVYLIPVWAVPAPAGETAGVGEMLGTDGFGEALLRSMVLGVAMGLGTIAVGFLLALALWRIPVQSVRGRLLSVLMLPALLGPMSAAFLVRSVLDGVEWPQTVWTHAGILILAHLWQYGTLYTYLFWLGLHGLPAQRLTYARATGLHASELLRDVVLPAFRGMFLMLFLLGFLFAAYEEAVSTVVLHASRGTESELVSVWLGRTYYSNLAVGLAWARFQLGQQTAIVVGMSMLTCVGLLMVLFVGLKGLARPTLLGHACLRMAAIFVRPQGQGWLVLAGLLTTVLAPVILALLRFTHELAPLWEFKFTAILTIIAALLAAAGLTAIFAAAARMGWPSATASLNHRSLALMLGVCLLLFVPPLSTLPTGYAWAVWLGQGALMRAYIPWVAGHALLAFPLLAGLMVVSHFRTPSRELDYHAATRTGTWPMLRDSFFRRYRADYAFSFLLACSLIWNETVINNVWSDYVPSFVATAKVALTGRAADDGLSMSCFLLSVGLALLAVLAWNVLLYRKSHASHD